MLLWCSCFTYAERDAAPIDFRFALTGNTYAESPFRGKNGALDDLIKKINDDNPLFLVHVGDIIHGGKKWMGISAGDMERQFRDVKTQFALLNPLFFTVKGEKDMLDASHDHYAFFTGRKQYYSFNYGTAHCIVLDTCENGHPHISPSQIEWLKRDLRRHRHSQGILLFSHYPMYHLEIAKTADKNDYIPEKQSNELHSLFVQYPVKAVFSGHHHTYFSTRKDAIYYITAGCDFSAIRIIPHQKSKGAVHYYIVDYRGGDITISQKSLEESK
jgi:3',5'-cyclic AMP phosphodiesterase CpdA